MMDALMRQDQKFLDFVKDHRSVGYGRMMQIISHEWYRDCQRRGDPVSGVLVANECLGFLTQKDQEAFARRVASDAGGSRDDH